MSRTITPKVLIAWDGTTYIDETANFVSATGSTKMSAPGNSIISPKGTVDNMTVVLYNRDRRYSPLNTSSALYAYIQNGGAYHRPIRFEVSIDGGIFSRVFTGVIKIPVEGTPTPKQEGTVSIECRSMDELLLQLKISTTGLALKNGADNPTTESEIIESILTHPDVNFTNYDLDRGFFTIPYFWMDDESVMEEIWSIAAACGGAVFTEPDGRLVYRNFQNWVAGLSQGKVKTFSRGDFTDLKVKWNDDDLYSAATVEASPRGLGENSVIWEPDDEITVPANGTRTVLAKLRQAAYFISEVSYQAVSSGGASLSVYVSVNAEVFAQRVNLVFTNTHPTQAANIKTLQIKGTPVVGTPTVEETVNSASSFWSSRKGRTRTLRNNVYVQSRAHAKALAQFLVNASEKPKVTYTIVNTPGSPAYSLGKLIGITDAKIISGERDAFITSVNWSYTSAGGYVQTIEAIDTSVVLAYNASDYFVIGTSTMSNCSGIGKRVYY